MGQKLMAFILVVAVVFLLILVATGEYKTSPGEFYQKYLAPDTTHTVVETTVPDDAASVTTDQGSLPTDMSPADLNAAGDKLYDTKDYYKAWPYYLKAANGGNTDAQYTLGYMCSKGYGVKQDDAEAVKWYRMAADQGNAYAQNNLGLMYQDGRGVDKDFTEAMKWYRKAADQKDDLAANNLGVMYENGEGVTVDLEEAVRWYRKAAELGNKKAKKNLSRLGK